MKLTDTPLCCFSGIHLSFIEGYSGKYHSDYVQLVINRISMTSIDTYHAFTYNMGIHVQVPVEINYVNIYLSNFTCQLFFL